MKKMMQLVVALLFAGGTLLAAQGTAESATEAKLSLYPKQWPPGPGESSAPPWARLGRVRFARWDGGPIETAKAMLSGWPGFNPPVPDYLGTMTNWYDPATVRLLREANINLIWVTFSNGFSIETERFQQELLRRYIDECHRQGIHVMAYESIANMFWEDMYAHVPESRKWAAIGKDGQPVPYGAAQYKAMGRVTRYMADMSNPGWRAYLRKRVDLAINAGADGVIYDNNFGQGLLETYRDIYQYATSRKSDFLLMGNFHETTYVFNRLINAITTEDGAEPGVYAEAGLGQGRMQRDRWSLLPLGSGWLVNNIGLYRIHGTLSEGWKATMIEPGHRELDGTDDGNQRLRGPMTGSRYQLAMAESMMFSIGTEMFVEGGFAHGLMRKDPATMSIWRAIGRYNRFFADNEEYYTGARSMASVAVVLDDRSYTVPLLNALAARNVAYDVLYEHDLTGAKLRPYSAILLWARTVRGAALAAIEARVAEGARLFSLGAAATLDEAGRGRARPALLDRDSGNGAGVYYERMPPLDELARTLRAVDRKPAVRVEAAPGVLYTVTAQPERGRVLVHLLNYTLRPAPGIKVAVRDGFKTARLLSPDSERQQPRKLAPTELDVPSPAIYSLLVLENIK